MDITQLLERSADGHALSTHQLMPIIYDRLRQIAARQLQRDGYHAAVETRELVHEAYIALFGEAQLRWRDRGHFFAYAAKTMRNILTDRARRRLAQKRGSAMHLADVDDIEVSIDAECLDLAALDQALARIGIDYPRVVQVVELRFFAGLSVEETAATLSIDPRSVERDWRKARAFINQALERKH